MTAGDSSPRGLDRVVWAGLWPLLPWVSRQGKRAWHGIERLPDAAGSPSGLCEVACAPSVEPVDVLVAGDSSVTGVGARSLRDALPGRFAQHLAGDLQRPVRWRSIGHRGATAERLLAELMGAGELQSHLTLLSFGVGDVLRMTRSVAFRATAAVLVSHLVRAGSGRVLVSGLPPMSSMPALPQPTRAVLGCRARLVEAWLRSVVSQTPGARFAPVSFPLGADHVARDGVHPSESGYDEWGRQLAAQAAASPAVRPSLGGKGVESEA